MDFGLSDEQLLLQDTFRGYLAEHVPIGRVRELAGGDGSGVTALWKDLAELGAAGVLIPEEHGGSELSPLDAALVAEEFGRAVTPTPFLSTAVLAPVALIEAGSPEQQKEWLPRIATGDLLFGAALTEAYARRGDAGVRLEGGSLNGKALLALEVASADLILVATLDRKLVLVERGATGLTIEPLGTIDTTRRVAELEFQDTSPAAVLAGGPEAIDRVLDAGRVVLAAETLGACQAMLDQAVAYSLTRTQFKRVIGSFQGVKHMCAEQAARLEPARSLIWFAAHAAGTLPEEAPLAVSHAKAHIAEVAYLLADVTTQVHGGVGFTDDQNLHFWFKRVGLNRQLLGSPDVLRRRAAELQGLGDTA